jgi:hypothetical protein
MHRMFLLGCGAQRMIPAYQMPQTQRPGSKRLRASALSTARVNRSNVELSQLGIFAKVGGFGGLVLFVFIGLFSRFADLKPLFGKMNADQTYKLVLTFLILTFSLCVLGLVSWVYISAAKKDSHTKRIALLVLLAALLAGGSLWATRYQTEVNIAKTMGGDGIPVPAPVRFEPPDLEAHKWQVRIRASGFPAFEGQIEFQADKTFMAQGKFLVPQSAVDQHFDCPANVVGHWSYPALNHNSLNVSLEISAFGDSGIAQDQYRVCVRALEPIQTKQLSADCIFNSAHSCAGNDVEIQLY